MQLASSLRKVPGDPSGMSNPEGWAHVNNRLHFALLPVPGTNWPAKHHSPLGGSWPSYGAMYIPKNRHAARHTVAAAALGLSAFFSPGDQKPHCESPNPKLYLEEDIMEFG